MQMLIAVLQSSHIVIWTSINLLILQLGVYEDVALTAENEYRTQSLCLTVKWSMVIQCYNLIHLHES